MYWLEIFMTKSLILKIGIKMIKLNFCNHAVLLYPNTNVFSNFCCHCAQKITFMRKKNYLNFCVRTAYRKHCLTLLVAFLLTLFTTTISQ